MAAKASKPAERVPEPNWTKLLDDSRERLQAKGHWKRITGEMKERETLSASKSQPRTTRARSRACRSTTRR